MAAPGIARSRDAFAPARCGRWRGGASFWNGCLAVLTACLAALPPSAVRGAEPAAAGPAEASPAVRPAAASLHRALRDAIDAEVAAAAVGPLAARCGDADFVRRIHLDLAGVIPTAARVREFLADPAGDKRMRLVDELLVAPAFARHMMLVLDAMLLERETPPGDLATQWREYLFRALDDDAPLDGLARDLLLADGGEPARKPATAFLAARDGEPVQVTRAIGRLLFGRDLQCAQCHDHPLVPDIRQAEHQGLYAFVARTSLFKGKDNALFVSEKADGEVDYQSVFTKDGEKGVWPRLPGGTTLVDEPRPEPDSAYEIAPSKESRGMPKFSRRAALAARLADDEGFRRNLANRIWAVFFGRGLVHPLDGFGPGNPPVHPRLLALLADTLRDHGFRLRPLVREIVLSETYQRSVDPPGPEAVDPAAVARLVAAGEAERPAREANVTVLAAGATAAEATRAEVIAATRSVHLERLGLVTARDAAKKAATAAAEAAGKASADLDRARQAAAALATAAAEVARAAGLDPADKPLAALAASFSETARKKAEAAEVAARAHVEKRGAADAAAAALEAARQAVDGATARLAAVGVLAVERDAAIARRAAVDAAHELRRLDARLALGRDLLAHAKLRGSDPAAAAIAWQSIVDRWTEGGQVAALRPLSAEQLALSVQQASGALAARAASAAAAIDKAPPEALAKASGDERSEIRAMEVEMRMVKDASGLLRSAATLFGDTMTEGFQASVNQALYFGNAPDILGQLAPTGDNLVARLATLGDGLAVADEAYAAVLARPPAADERADVAAFLAPRAADRPQALAELVWALVSSNEFRFNH